VCQTLGLRPVPATQVIARDRHAEYLYACAALGTTIEALATEVRHLQRTEVGEVEEYFSTNQKGSSAMPHKRNPITAERLTGLARVLRGYLISGLEDVALWHERDISTARRAHRASGRKHDRLLRRDEDDLFDRRPGDP